MRLRDIIGLILALFLAVGVAFLTRIFLTKEEKPPEIAQEKKITKVLVAAKTLSVGDTVKAGDLTWQEWPATAITPSDMTEESAKIEEFMGSIVRSTIHKGNPIVREELVKRGDKGLLAAIITPGKRAVSIDVTASSSGSGLIYPGDFVDVILSTTVPEGPLQVGKSKTILKNIKVLAFDTALSPPNETPKTPPHVATLEMKPEEADILMAAVKEGVISLSLHSMEAGDPAGEGAEVQAKSPAVKKAEDRKIILMRGKEKSEIQFKEK
ncbi:MAG: Flp pilus assembly protein CpaB [Alphaproteobacteria bacterium]|nr:Flp pilus assembly protein CpaB [Alphaproteobacteria bacterium]